MNHLGLLRELFREMIVILACALWLSVDCTRAHAAPCDAHRDAIYLAAREHRVPVLLLHALAFAESSCRADNVNDRTQATGLLQLIPGKSAAPTYTQAQLRNPWLNAYLGAAHLRRWHNRCGTWRGALEVYNGRRNCRVRSSQGEKVIKLWNELERREEPRS